MPCIASAELNAKRQTELDAAEALVAKAQADGKEFTNEEQAAYDGHMAAAKLLKKQIKQADEVAAEKADLATDRKTLQRPLVPLEAPVTQPGGVPAAIIGKPAGSQGYSFMRAAGYVMGAFRHEDPESICKEEIQASRELHKIYYGVKDLCSLPNSIIVPFSARDVPDAALARQLRQQLAAGVSRFDPDEARHYRQQFGAVAMGTVNDTAGGTFVPYPQQMDFIDLQRNMEVFPTAGATEVSFSPQGSMRWPKLNAGATAAFVGEGNPGAESNETTGELELLAKQLLTFVRLNNQVIRFSNPSIEAVVRNDMARVTAIRADLAMLDGASGGTGIRGILSYQGSPSAFNNITLYPSLGAATNGDVVDTSDPVRMASKLPDAVRALRGDQAYVMHPDMSSILRTRRAGSGYSAADGAGLYLIDPARTGQESPWDMMNGRKIIDSGQVSQTRVKGTGTTLTYILLGYFPDWIIARLPIMEFAVNPYEATGWSQSQIVLRATQYIDAGPRHAPSFVLCDYLLVA